MRWQRIVTMIVTIFLVAVCGVVLFPIYQNNAILGLDLQGGVMVRLEAPEGTSGEDMDNAVSVISNRINALGVSEPEIRREGDNRISVELPGVSDADEAVRVIGTTAKLQFARYDNGEIILSGSQLKKATAFMDQETIDPTQQFGVSLEFNNEGATQFAQATTELCNLYGENDPNRIIAIILDDAAISTPGVREPITNGKASITGSFTSFAEANSMASMLNGGALPVDLSIVEKRTVGPQLGADSIAKSVTAAAIGVAVLALFMIVVYRVPGLIAVFALLLYGIVVIGLNVAINVTMTLPVIAAFLLSVGMAVDANVIIFERIKEELRVGKTIRVAVDSGFKKAFTTIFDSNITTLLAAVILIAFGTGTIRGFAITLTIGILVSMLTAITFTRFMLKQLVSSNLITNVKFYGM